MSAFQREGSATEDLAELARCLSDGELDLIAVGRVLLADPYWLAKVRDGRLDLIEPVGKDAIDRYW